VELLSAEYRDHVFPRHAQENVVFGFVDRGEVRVVSGGETLTVGEGDVLFISPGTVHEARGTGDGTWVYRALYLSPAQWMELSSGLGTRAPQSAAVIGNRAVRELVERTHRRLSAGDLGDRHLSAILRDLVDRVVQSIGENQPVTAVNEAGACVERVRRVLDTQFTRRVPLREMADVAGLSPFHFLRAFTRAYGVSPCAYSLNRRLLEAQRRLSIGEPISTTAFEFGFADQAHLTRHFLRTVGVTPGEYQRAFTA
jgi:AraC-like DNA-binding protein